MKSIGALTSRITSLYARFAVRAYDLDGELGAMASAKGGVSLTVLRLSDGLIEVAGTARDSPVVLRAAEVSSAAAVAPGDPFFLTLSLPAGVSPTAVRLDIAGQPVPLPWRLARLAQLSVLVEFLSTSLRSIPDAIRWFRRRDPVAKARIKRALRLDAIVSGHDVPPDLFEQMRSPADPGPFTILLPVYNAVEVLTDCLDRIERHTHGAWSMIAVDDASPDPRVQPLLRDFAARHPQVRVETIAENQGFVGAVNHGLRLLEKDDHPVVLLNSDALVPAGWDRRLLGVLSDETVASATPMSNDAEIFGVPAICGPVGLGAGDMDALDQVAQGIAPAPAVAVAPTGVGFCMALSRHWLDRVPRLDTAFGRGYGEEVDWCQKVRALGGRHVGVGNLFVEHRGGGSFGAEAKARLIARNGAEISRRYPQYDLEVQRFIASDPLAGPRLALAVAWAERARSDEAIPIYVAHWLGGGADIWLQKQISDRLSGGLPSIVLRVGGPCSWQLEVFSTGGVIKGKTNDFELVRALLAPLTHRRVVYSNGVGAADPDGLPNVMLELAQGGPVEVLFHDYFPISRDFNLMRPGDRFRGPRVGGQGADWALDADPDWQEAWAPLHERADRLVCFSAESARLIGLARPDLCDRLEIMPHRVPKVAAMPRPANTAQPVLAGLGNLGEQKGVKVMADLSRVWARKFPKARLIVLGDVDPAFAFHRSAKVHGQYDPAAITELAIAYGVTHWIIPSIWPETFSFTTHEALATGRPVLAFDIGAQGAAVSAAANGHAIAWDPDRNPLDLVLGALAEVGFQGSKANGKRP